MSKHKIRANERFSPLAVKLREINDLKQAVNNSKLPERVKADLMRQYDREYNQAWRNHYAGVPGYEITSPHPMSKIRRVMNKVYGMDDIHVKDVNNKTEYIHGQNEFLILFVVPPHDNMKQWMLRAAPRVTFDRWSNSTAVEKFFDNKNILCDYITKHKDEIVEKVLASLSREITEFDEEHRTCEHQHDDSHVATATISVYNRSAVSDDTVCRMSVNKIYKLITDYINEGYDVSRNEISTLISWLPTLKTIEVSCFAANDYIKMCFENGHEIEFVNTGIEAMLSEYVDKNGDNVE